MEKLKELLAKSSKIKRNQRVLLNIQVQVLAWMVEFTAMLTIIITIFLPFGQLATMLANHLAGLGFFVLVPGVYLINNQDFKDAMMNKCF